MEYNTKTAQTKDVTYSIESRFIYVSCFVDKADVSFDVDGIGQRL